MMEASAKQHRASTNRCSFEDSHHVPRRIPNSRQEDVLSLNSWSDCEKSDFSDSSLRDQDHDLQTRSTGRRRSKEHKTYDVDRRQSQEHCAKKHSMGSSSFQEIPTNSVPVQNVDQHSTHHSSVPLSLRSRSSSNIERGPYGSSIGAEKYVYDYSMCPNACESAINYEQEFIDQPANPFQDFSYLGFQNHGPTNTSTSKDCQKKTSNIKTSTNLYPVLNKLEHESNGSSYLEAQPRGGSSFLGELDDGPASMPVISNSSDLGKDTPFQSLPASVSLIDYTRSPSHMRDITPSQDSQGEKKNSKDSQTKGLWSIWKLHQSQPILSKAPALKRQPKSSSDLEALRESFEHRLEHDNVKTKVISAWNNFKYGNWRL